MLIPASEEFSEIRKPVKAIRVHSILFAIQAVTSSNRIRGFAVNKMSGRPAAICGASPGLTLFDSIPLAASLSAAAKWRSCTGLRENKRGGDEHAQTGLPLNRVCCSFRKNHPLFENRKSPPDAWQRTGENWQPRFLRFYPGE